MEIYHRIGFNPRRNPALVTIVEKLGISYQTLPLPGYKVGLIYIDIAESDPTWPELHKALVQWPASDRFDTIFNPEEILSAEWLRAVPVYEKGEIKPDTPKWRYDLYEGYCRGCGAYERQKNPVKLAKEPKRPEGYFVSPVGPYLLLCSPSMEEMIREAGIQGYEEWPVLHYKTGEALENTVQLYIPHVTKPGLTRTEGLRQTQCAMCGRIKYQPHMRGVMYIKREAMEDVDDFDIVYSHEWFGSGHGAYREILVSNRFARLCLEKEWKGIRFKVVELV